MFLTLISLLVAPLLFLVMMALGGVIGLVFIVIFILGTIGESKVSLIENTDS